MQTNTDPRTSAPPPEQPLSPAPLPDEPYYRRGEQARRWGGVLLLIGLVWLVFALSSRASFLSIGLAEQSIQEFANLPGGTQIVIVGGSDNVEFVPSGEPGIHVEATKYGFGLTPGAATDALNQLEVAFRPEGDTLYVEVRRPLGSVLGRAPYADLRVALPREAVAQASVVSGDIVISEVAADLTLSTVSGNVASDATRGALTLTTTSGDLEVSDHAGPLRVESVSGDVRVDGRLASPYVETVSGDARLEGATGSVELSSISGDLSLEGARLEGLKLESTSGDIEARFGLASGATGSVGNISGDVQVQLEGADVQIDASTASGEISSDLRGLDEERRSLRGRLGSGEATLTINTTSGDIEVRGE